MIRQMSLITRIVVACLSVIGILVVYSLLVHIFHYAVLAAVVVGILYVSSRVLRPRPLAVSRRRILP